MSSSGLDIAELSDSERSALETYTTVTGQEPSEAIPLLRRCQWNVQIAISKFFDGEGPDPVEEARAVLDNTPPPRSNRQTQNLMRDDLRAQLAPTIRAADPALRVVTQPEEQPVYRPPLLLALLFTPVNLLYRFIREFEEEYGTNSLGFLENGYNMVLEKAHQDLKFLLVVLLAPEHDDTNGWVRDTLLSREVVEFVNDPQNDVLIWGGNVQDSEAYQVANSLRCTKFPFAAAIVHTPNVSSTAMSVVTRISGTTSPPEFVEKLRSAISQYKEPLERIGASRAEQQASRSLREQQDSAYERSLAIDRERARQRREAEAARQREEQEAAERQAAEEKRIHDQDQWKRWRVQTIPDEPGPEVKDAVRISIRLPSGERVIRKFGPDADIEELYAFVECYDILQESQERDTDVEKPSGFEHEYQFRLVSPMPRTVHEIDAGRSIRDQIGRGGNVLVEPIDEESDEEEEDA
ncbi:hypothetical protein EYZ11_003906 [Aspergillus tanneri]|uniref:UBX domain-containing protein n=1 Tax=Aspergillus tanneri TaxID=1220188 RepID=A0A4V3UPV5_9EURO|nr:hypothetical protein EYZ11_003906 [Aspergillus tanneri]